MNLIEALQAKNEESRDFLRELEATASAMDGPSGGLQLSAEITRGLIAKTEEAIASGDVMQMLGAAAAHGIGAGEEPIAETEEAP